MNLRHFREIYRNEHYNLYSPYITKTLKLSTPIQTEHMWGNAKRILISVRKYEE